MTQQQRRRRITRDTVIVTVALGLLVYEVTFGGGRPSVLTAVTSLLLSPLVIRLDEARKTTKPED